MAFAAVLVSLVNPKFHNFSRPMLLAFLVGLFTFAGVLTAFLVLASADRTVCMDTYPLHVGPYSSIGPAVNNWLTPPPAEAGVAYSTKICFRAMRSIEDPSGLYGTHRMFTTPCLPDEGFFPRNEIYDPTFGGINSQGVSNSDIAWCEGSERTGGLICEAWVGPIPGGAHSRCRGIGGWGRWLGAS